MKPHIRSAGPADTADLVEIYRPAVERSATSFELVVPSVEEFAARIAAAHLWLVAEIDGRCVGYAYGGAHRAREAYRWSVETSVYVHGDHHRKGIARALYEELLPELERRGFCNAFAGTALPNPASVGFHESFGFEPIGVFKRVGYKFGAWHDVAWFQRKLRDAPPDGAA